MRGGFLIVGLGFLFGVPAQATTIDPANFASGTDLGNPFLGIALETVRGQTNFVDNDPTPTLIDTIRQTGPSLGSVFARGSFFASANHPDWAADPEFGRLEIFKASFSIAIETVAMTFHPGDLDTVVMGVFDAGNNLLSHQFLRAGQPFTFSYTVGTTPISYILAATADSGNLGALEFRLAQVPEPTI